MDEIYDKFAAGRMGIDQIGQVVLMIHCGSRGKFTPSNNEFQNLFYQFYFLKLRFWTSSGYRCSGFHGKSYEKG